MSIRAKESFVLIEVLVYLTLSLFLVLLLFSFFSLIQKKLTVYTVFQESVVRDSLVMDVLHRDLVSASMDRSDWNEREFVFKKEMINKKRQPVVVWVGWKVVDKGVWRTEGVYDNVIKRWGKRYTRLFGCKINQLQMRLQLCNKRNNVEQITIRYTKKHDDRWYEESVRFRNRILR